MKLGFHSRWLAGIAAAGVVAATAAPALAQPTGDTANFPSRPIRFITPAAPGGTTDILARLFSDRLSQIFKQQVVVDNRASAAGVLAAELTATAAPDGYTLFMGYHQHTINAALLPKLPQALVKRLHSELVKVLHGPKMQKTIFDQGATAVGSTPEEFRRYLLADMAKWKKVVQASGAKAY